MPKLTHRYHGIVMPLVLSAFMSFVISGIATFRAVGLDDAFLGTWMMSWGWSWAIAFPTLLIVLPMVRRIVALVVEPPSA
jgi:hypothetical protein